MAAMAPPVHRTGSRAHMLSAIYQTSVTSLSTSANDFVSKYCVQCNDHLYCVVLCSVTADVYTVVMLLYVCVCMYTG